MSIRLRLTLLFGALVTITFVASAALIYLALDQVTITHIADALSAQAADMASKQAVRSSQLALPSMTFATQETYIQVSTPGGVVIGATTNLRQFRQRLPLDAVTVAALQHGQARLETVSMAQQPLLLLSRSVTDQRHLVEILQVGHLLTEHDQMLATLRVVLSVVGGFAILLGTAAGWLLAGLAIRPLQRITTTAEAIGAAQDFARRIVYDGARDEVGRLVLAFNAMLERLQRAHQAQRRFIDDAAHELRTPLTTIRGNLHLLQREPQLDASEQRDVVSDMVEETDRLTRLTDELLTLASADSERRLQRQRVDLTPLLDAARRQAEILAPGRTLICHCESGLAVVGDQDALSQVVLILLDNAFKFTPPDTAVTVSADALGPDVAIRVHDDGPGIAPNLLPHIFERFTQGDEARAIRGSGLGLAIAKALVDSQGGTISVDTAAGRGTTFTVTLMRTP
jgi:signal transduction histidine kinase